MSRVDSNKPILVQVGDSFVDPTDVAAIVRVKKNLFVIRLKSQPNPEYPLWVEEKNIGALMSSFRIVEDRR